MGRLREKYAAKMSGADQRAFEVVMAGLGTNSAEFRDVARVVASVDTLDGFIRDVQARYPDMTVLPRERAGPAGRRSADAAKAGPRADRVDRTA